MQADTKIIEVDWPADERVCLAAIHSLYNDHPGERRQFHVFLKTAEQANQALDTPGFRPVLGYGPLRRLSLNEIGMIEIFRFFGPDHYFGA